MTGNIAQIIALISHGNHYLKSGQMSREFSAQNSAFQFCNRVDFWRVGKRRRLFRSNPKLVSPDPTAWFEYLRLSGSTHLRFRYFHSTQQDHITAGFVGGGGVWLIDQLVNEECIEWRSAWTVTEERNPENKIWSVSYSSDLARRSAKNDELSVNESRQRLANALEEIMRFAVSIRLGWVAHFEKALSALDSLTPEAGFYHPDLLMTETYLLEQRQLFYAAGLAWCFGGMGSWSDTWLESDELQVQHEQVSSELFEAINQAFATVLS